MKIINLITKNHQEVISQTLSALRSGGLVVFPSDTVYGLLADATNPRAIDKLLEFKERPTGKAISVFVADEKMAKEYVFLNQNAKNVIRNLLPGPFTVVCQSRQSYKITKLQRNKVTKKQSYKETKLQRCKDAKFQSFKEKPEIDKRLLAENGSLGFRIPDYPLLNKLVTAYGLPLTATSANLSGKPPHYSIFSLLNSLSHKKKHLLDLIINANTLPHHKPSTVIDTTAGKLKTLRLGDLLPATSNSLISKSEDETKKLGQYLATKFINKSLSKPLVFLLQGELGAGKTILAKGVGQALKIKEEIVSPTYNLCLEYFFDNSKLINSHLRDFDSENISQNTNKKYKMKSKLIHYDLYRIESAEELKELNFLKNFFCGNIYLIEWPERIPETSISALKKLAEIVFVKIKHLDEKTREIEWND